MLFIDRSSRHVWLTITQRAPIHRGSTSLPRISPLCLLIPKKSGTADHTGASVTLVCDQNESGGLHMSTAKAAIVDESMNKRHLRGLPSRMRRTPPARRAEKIREMASALLEEAASLEHESGMAEVTAAVETLNQGSSIDFFEEVRRFEIRLIGRAMELAGGNQVRAARLLGLGNTTLNYKIKSYQLL